MPFGKWILVYALSFVAFLAIDMVWLGVVAKGFYRRNLAYLMSPSVKWPVAIAFYLLFVAGVLVFAVRPGLDAGTAWHATLLGAFFGLCAYATYDLTNWSTVKDYPAAIAVVDTLWGAVLSGLTATIGFFIARALV